jgi:EmrB/QacA subfamily drug resistance transporter
LTSAGGGSRASAAGAASAGGRGAAWRRRPVALAALCTLLFLTFLDNTVVSVALASIRADLQAGVSALQWVVGAYALTFAALMLTFGMVSDEFGRKKVMLAGAAVYCAGAAMSALATSLTVLIAGRAVMGLGAAASEPGTLSMIRQLYRDERSRNRALGVWAAVSGFSLALGPVLGGTLVGAWSWRGIFWFDVTFGIAALAVAAKVLPESADPKAGRVDIPGTVLGAAALAALVFAVINGETAGFAAAGVIALYCLSAAAAAAFVIWERRAPHPLLDLHFLRVAKFATPNVIAACCYFATFAIFFFTALYLGEVAGYSGYRIAAVFLPMTIVMIAASLVAGRLTSVVGIRMSLVAGCLLFAAGLLVTNLVLGPHPSYLALAAALGLAGAGLGASVVPVTSSVLAAVPPERSGMAASATNTSREIGAVVGVVVLGALINAELKAGLISRMTRLNLPASLQALVIGIVQTGGGGSVALGGLSGSGTGGSGGSGGLSGLGGAGGLIGQLFQAGYAAFESALHVALYLSAALLAGAALLAAITLRRRPQVADSNSSRRS